MGIRHGHGFSLRGLWSAIDSRLPGQCRLCHAWQNQIICTSCQTRWRTARYRCQRCAIPLQAGPEYHPAPECAACWDAPPEFDRAIAALDYAPPWSHLVQQVKFHDDTALSQTLATLLCQAIRHTRYPIDLIVPIPLSPNRMSERGYNQAWLLAQHVSRALGVPARHDLLQRTHETERLMNLDADARRQHIADAFTVTPSASAQLRHRHIALVDDVLTTGATLNEAARTVRAAGARSISAWTLCRTPSPGALQKAMSTPLRSDSPKPTT